MTDIIKWLLEGEPWIVYRTRLDLLNQSENQPDVASARKQMIGHPKIQSLLEELSNWPGVVLSSHKSASQPYHKLSLLADFGLNKGDPYIKEIVDKIYGAYKKASEENMEEMSKRAKGTEQTVYVVGGEELRKIYQYEHNFYKKMLEEMGATKQ